MDTANADSRRNWRRCRRWNSTPQSWRTASRPTPPTKKTASSSTSPDSPRTSRLPRLTTIGPCCNPTNRRGLHSYPAKKNSRCPPFRCLCPLCASSGRCRHSNLRSTIRLWSSMPGRALGGRLGHPPWRPRRAARCSHSCCGRPTSGWRCQNLSAASSAEAPMATGLYPAATAVVAAPPQESESVAYPPFGHGGLGWRSRGIGPKTAGISAGSGGTAERSYPARRRGCRAMGRRRRCCCRSAPVAHRR
mmetsp:Transcript_114891/g.324730  ORF Transcript_114891/g.324730 Transcript_114891/m.324730 type:complete len:248 (-) Transcript_114891:817-1560(-)